MYEIQVEQRVETVAADRLKPHRGPAPGVAQPLRRGRPPGTGGSVDLVGPGLGEGPCGGCVNSREKIRNLFMTSLYILIADL